MWPVHAGRRHAGISTTMTRLRALLPTLSAPVLAASAVAAPQAPAADGPVTDRAVIAEALSAVSDEVRVYNDHLTILASPWMEGRLPGTRGMELAKEYMEFHFAQSGLVAPLPKTIEGADGTQSIEPQGSFRQEFNLGSSRTVKGAAAALGRTLEFEHGIDADFTVTGLGSGGEVVAPAVFVGYAIDEGPDDFTSFAEDVDLEGKVAVMLRFEPMNGEGKSLWASDRQAWSRRAGFTGKLKAVADRGAVAAIIINTPGASDRRVNTLLNPGGGGRGSVPFPVLHMSAGAGALLVAEGIGGGKTLESLRDEANTGPMGVEFGEAIRIQAEIERRTVVAENVIGLLPGKGRLADQYIVVGAHLDHLGQGAFGSRDQENAGRLLHPGADDNASGSAGIILIADKMAKDYAAAGDDANLRSVLFMGFSAEESGLNGSAYYANNPIYPIENHVLMMNFDMIGRIENRRLSLSGAATGGGLAEFLKPIVDASPLEIVQPENMRGASDHTSFMRKQIPVLFAIIADFHADYHTPRDVSSLINRVDAVHAANLFYEIALSAAQRPEAFPFVDRREANRRRRAERNSQEAEATAEASTSGSTPRASSRVRFGIRPNYEDEDAGVLVEAVTPESAAARAGLLKNDRLMTWNGEEIADARAFGALLRGAKPGDKVKVGIRRAAETVTVEVTLEARRTGD